jgi:hypothetical protein
MRCTPLVALSVISAMPLLGGIGCGDVVAPALPDAGASDATGPDAALNPCAPAQCLLFDDFEGAALDPSRWGQAVTGGATITEAGGKLTIHLPAAPEASADVYSLVGFPSGASLETSITVTAGQFYDHTGVGFASARVDNQCDVGETEAAMFRGQDADGYVETKTASAYSCVKNTTMYPGGTSTLQIMRATDKVVFIQNGAMLAPITTNIPAGLLPVRFSAYTYATAPSQPVELTIDYVFVRHP